MAYEDLIAAIDTAVANPGRDVAGPLQALVDALIGSGFGLPAGGDTGDFLTKDSPVDGDASWSTVDTDAAIAAAFLAFFGPEIEHVEAIARTAYDLLSPPDATTLYVIDEAS